MSATPINRTDLEVTRDGAVVLVRFNRPEKYNAVRTQTMEEIVDVLAWTAADTDVRAVVFTGVGRAFCAGQDLDELEGLISEGMRDADQRVALDGFQAITRMQIEHPKVLIAAINGVAVGFGAELALACDLRIAGPSGRVGFVEVTRALFETNGVTYILPRLIGHGRAAEMLLTGEIINAVEAHRIGLVNRLSGESVETEAMAWAHQVANNAPISLDWVKKALRVTWDRDIGSMMDLEVDGMLASLASADLVEGLRSFAEGRPAKYEGR